MRGRSKKGPREKNMTARLLASEMSGGDADDATDSQERFNKRSKFAQQNKTTRTAALRRQERAQRSADQTAQGGEDLDALPVGEVLQVFSLFLELEHESDRAPFLATVRKTLQKVAATQVLVGDRVRFRPSGALHESGKPEAVIEEILPRRTVLSRSDSFKSHRQNPIVANADQMLIVAALAHPFPRWGLVDRMLIAAQSGGLKPIVCLNKTDLEETDDESRAQWRLAQDVLAHYEKLGIATTRTSVEQGAGLDTLRSLLHGRTTVLSGHSGVGKSSLIRAIQPQLDLRIGEVSVVTAKGRHTTTSARRYPLDFGGAVIDTPGVKVFGLWGVTRDNLLDFFPDVADDSAPIWRRESYDRIAASLA